MKVGSGVLWPNFHNIESGSTHPWLWIEDGTFDSKISHINLTSGWFEINKKVLLMGAKGGSEVLPFFLILGQARHQLMELIFLFVGRFLVV